MNRRIHARRGRAVVALALAAFALTAGVALSATAGDLDPSFDQDGKLVLPFKITPGHVLPQADGKLLVTDELSATVARLNSDGSLDRSYDGDGVATGFLDDGVGAATLQPDGKLVVASSNAQGDFTVARLETDGSLDESFGPGGPDGDGRRRYTDLQAWYPDAMVVQPDGRIAIAGISSAGITVSRLKDDGAPDGTSFDYAGMGSIRGAALAQDGRIVVAGYVGAGESDDLVVVRYKSDGKLDTTLGGSGRVEIGPKDRDDVPAAVLVQDDGKIVIAEDSGTTQKRMTVMRLKADGGLDRTFAGDGTATPEFVGETFAVGAAIQPDGKILVAGMLGSEGDFGVARLDRDGAPDAGFGTDGKTSIAFEGIALPYAAGLQPDGKFVIAGLAVVQNGTAVRTVLARVLADQPPAQPDAGPQPGTGDGGAQPGTGGDPQQTPPPLPRCAGKPATIVGTPGADTLRGTERADVIVALGGDDRVRAAGRGDVVCGGPGRDRSRACETRR